MSRREILPYVPIMEKAEILRGFGPPFEQVTDQSARYRTLLDNVNHHSYEHKRDGARVEAENMVRPREGSTRGSSGS